MTAEQTLRKYFHGLTDEQFEEDINRYPLNSVLGAMREHTLQVATKAVEKQKKHWWPVDDKIVWNVHCALNSIIEDIEKWTQRELK